MAWASPSSYCVFFEIQCSTLPIWFVWHKALITHSYQLTFLFNPLPESEVKPSLHHSPWSISNEPFVFASPSGCSVLSLRPWELLCQFWCSKPEGPDDPILASIRDQKSPITSFLPGMKNIYITWSYKVRFGVGFPDSVEKSALSRWKVSAGGVGKCYWAKVGWQVSNLGWTGAGSALPWQDARLGRAVTLPAGTAPAVGTEPSVFRLWIIGCSLNHCVPGEGRNSLTLDTECSACRYTVNTIKYQRVTLEIKRAEMEKVLCMDLESMLPCLSSP